MTPLSISLLPPGTPFWIMALVVAGLVLHIGGGMVAIVSGASALAVRKGDRLHRLFGNVFFVSMLVMSSAATALALHISQVGNVIGGGLAFYLVATAWATVRRTDGKVGPIEYGSLFVTTGAALGNFICGAIANASPHGFQGYASSFYFIGGGIISFIALIDLRTILRGGVSGVNRIARHVWRMCVSLFIATGSFFLGQQKVMPLFVHHSPVLLVLGFAPLALMAYWLVRIRVGNWYGGGTADRVTA